MKLSRKTKPHTYHSLVNSSNDQLIGGLIVHLQTGSSFFATLPMLNIY